MTQTIRFSISRLFPFILIAFLGSSVTVSAQDAQRTQLEQGLSYKPIQEDVDIDVPTEEEKKQCEMKLTPDKRGFVITGPQRNTLRLFTDANGDNRVDQWSYFNNGVEVYREIDSNGNGKADEFRWLNSAGTRWGVDTNEDKIIDYWKEISAEEVSREIVLAMARNDVDRFLRVALNEEELKNLALGETLRESVARKVATLRAGFAQAVQAIGFKSDMIQWYQFNAVMPGLVPGGDRGNQKDLVVFENAMVTIGDGNDARQIALGTLVKIADNNWRVLDLPKNYDENLLSFTFIQPAQSPASPSAPNAEVVALISEYEKILAEIPTLPVAQRPDRHKEVFARMIKLMAISATDEERENWIRQLADAIMVASQANEFPQGSEQLRVLYETVQKEGNDELTAFVRNRQIMTDYYMDIIAGNDAIKSQLTWLENLEKLANDYGKTEAGVDAMMQLAAYREMTQRSAEEPMKWYAAVVENAGNKPVAEKARGAIRRLNSKDRVVPFKATDTSGKPFDIASLKDKFVLLCFWDSRVVGELPPIKTVADRFAKDGLVVVGVNLDADPQAMKTALAQAQLNWPQLFAPGGLENPMAVYWGIQNTPYMILYGKDGKVAQPNVQSPGDLQITMGELLK